MSEMQDQPSILQPPPPPVVNALPLLSADEEITWFEGNFGGTLFTPDWFGYYGHGRLGLASVTVSLTGRRLSRIWRMIYSLPLNMLTIPAIIIIMEAYHQIFLYSIIGILISHFLQDIAGRIIWRYAAQQETLDFPLHRLSTVIQTRRRIVFQAPDEKGKLRTIVFYAKTDVEAVTIANRLYELAQPFLRYPKG